MLCGLSMNIGICYNIIDYIYKGKEWVLEYCKKFYEKV